MPTIRLATILQVVACSVLFAAQPAQAQDGWVHNPATGHYYKVLASQKWADAQAAALSAGAYLTTINDEAENNWLISEESPVDQSVQIYWIGFTDEEKEGDWVWVNGEPVTYTNWSPIQPSNSGGGEHHACLFIITHPEVARGEWNDDANVYHPAIMERDYAPDAALRTLTISLEGHATVLRTPSGTSYPASYTYPDGEAVTLNAQPDAHWTFSQWGGDATGTGQQVVITMDADHAVTAIFTADDDDEDGLEDWWEARYGLDLATNDAEADLDEDGLTNAEEQDYGTRPDMSDTDNDGMSDFDEVQAGSNPLDAIVFLSKSGDNTTGDTWATAFWSLHDAVAEAARLDADIWIAGGQYNIGSPVPMQDGVAIYGGFPSEGLPLFEERDPDQFVTTFDGQGAASHILTCDAVTDVHIEGLRITGTTGSGGGYAAGGGIRVQNEASNVSIVDCLFEYNDSSGFGGGINFHYASVAISDCVFRHNRSRDGGGVKGHRGQATLSNCLFEDNISSDKGGGFSAYDANVTARNCVFRRNQAKEGGGFNCHEGSAVVLANCLFEDNYASSQGGGARFYSQRPIDIVNCTFVNNTTPNYGGGLWIYRTDGDVDIANCIFVNNNRGAVWRWENSTPPRMSNCLFHQNPEGVFRGGTDTVLMDVGALNAVLGANPGNVAGDPNFANPAIGNYHITAASPCRGAADETYAPNYDYDGEARPDGSVDIGYDQFVDTDGDMAPDWWETRHGLNPGAVNSALDTDGDNLLDPEEYFNNTNPRAGDSDGDGAADDVELARGTNPNNVLRPPVYVSKEGDNTTGDSWATALWSLHDAVALAEDDGKDVWVAEADYKVGSPVSLPSVIALYGGFPATGSPQFGDRDPGMYETELNGLNATSHIFDCNHVMDVAIDGFSMTGITGGDGGGYTGAAVLGHNGAMGIAVSNCTFFDIIGPTYGGGINFNGSTGRVSGCTFRDNETYHGPGIKMHDAKAWVEDCLFSNNEAGLIGGGVTAYGSFLSIKRSYFLYNTSGKGGAGIDSFQGQGLMVEDCVIAGNETVDHGGGINCGSEYLRVANCTFSTNNGERGGAIFMNAVYGSITNSIFAQNDHHALYENDTNSDPIIRNCLFFDNPDGVYLNEGAATIDDAATPDGLNTVLLEATGNLDGNPAFIPGDFHVAAVSPAIDAGYGLAGTLWDLDGFARPVDVAGYGTTTNVYDIGAYEFSDTDGDNLPDYWEMRHGLDPGTADDNEEDTDADGVNLLNEYLLNGDPNTDDADGDGLLDGWEADHGLDLWRDDADEDPDEDGYTNAEEQTYGTDPNDMDSAPAAADLGVSTNTVTLTETSPSAEVNVLNMGQLPLVWSAESDTPSVVVAPVSGSGETVLTITATDFTMDVTANVIVSNTVLATDKETIVVHVEQTALPGNLDVSTNEVTLDESAPSAQVNVLNTGELPLSWFATSDSASVTVTPASGEGGGTLSIATADFTTDRTANITIVNDDDATDTETVVVHVVHTPLPADLGVSTNALTLSEETPSASFNVLNAGELPIAWTATSDTASVTLAPGTGTGAGSVTVTAADFSQDITATITVVNDADAADKETIVVQVRYTRDPADLSVSTTAITLTERAPSSTFNILNLGELPVSWTCTSDNAVVEVSDAAGDGEAVIEVIATDFSQTLTVNITVTNIADATDTETVVVTVEATSGPGCAVGALFIPDNGGPGQGIIMTLAALLLLAAHGYVLKRKTPVAQRATGGSLKH